MTRSPFARLEKRSDATFLREMIGFAADRLMQLSPNLLCGAAFGERTPERLNRRNGSRERDWEARAGNVELVSPLRSPTSKLRRGSYVPAFLELRRMAEKARAGVIQDASIQGISTRLVDDLVQAMGLDGIGKSQVSRLCGEIDERVNAFLDRPAAGGWPHVWLDATAVKARRDHHIVSVAVIVGVNTDARPEVLGMTVGHSEAEPFWTQFLRSLARRGLRGVKPVVSDAHAGLKAAITKVRSATGQRCRVHFMRNAMAYAGKTQLQARRSAASSQPGSARRSPRTTRLPPASCGARSPTKPVPGCPSWPSSWTTPRPTCGLTWASLGFPGQHRVKLHSTNPPERLNGEIKRRSDGVGIFPNEAALTRLIGALRLEQKGEWTVQRARYMSLETSAPPSDDATASSPPLAA